MDNSAGVEKMSDLKATIYRVHIKQALRQILRIERERILLNGHFSKTAKQYSVKVADLRDAYNKEKYLTM